MLEKFEILILFLRLRSNVHTNPSRKRKFSKTLFKDLKPKELKMPLP